MRDAVSSSSSSSCTLSPRSPLSPLCKLHCRSNHKHGRSRRLVAALCVPCILRATSESLWRQTGAEKAISQRPPPSQEWHPLVSLCAHPWHPPPWVIDLRGSMPWRLTRSPVPHASSSVFLPVLPSLLTLRSCSSSSVASCPFYFLFLQQRVFVCSLSHSFKVRFITPITLVF
jgi:hypothetical protein